MGDVLMMVPIMGAVFAVSLAIIGLLASAEGIGLDELSSMDSSELPPSTIVVPTLIQQAAWFGWPLIVSRWKGLGAAADWGLKFEPVDLGIGLGTAMIALFMAGLGGAITSALVGLEDDSLADNTQVITDMEGTPWLWGILFIVVIGAPFSEELLFRGLILRSVAKRWGSVAGVIGSLLLFVPIHYADGGIFGPGQIVLWVSIALLGAVLAITAVVTGRLGAPIVAHILINAIGAANALGYLDGLEDMLPA